MVSLKKDSSIFLKKTSKKKKHQDLFVFIGKADLRIEGKIGLESAGSLSQRPKWPELTYSKAGSQASHVGAGAQTFDPSFAAFPGHSWL